MEYLGIQENPKGKGWAAGAGYGKKILTILAAITGTKADEKPQTPQQPQAPQKPQENETELKPYHITTTTEALRIRDKPNGNIVGAIREKEGHKKQYTIVEEQNGWGRLKPGAGWISLEFCKKTGETTEVFASYLITTTCDVLCIRKTPGGEKVGAIREKEGHKKQYTIVEEHNGWGRLKSGAGWISLEFCKKAS